MTFFFYDLETSSGNPRTGRIMQFAGQRTNENLELIGQPFNLLIRLSDDVIPEPDAILIHGITPQRTIEEGITEAEFLEIFQSKIALTDTIFVGYNNIRFDDEFMRLVCYRSFYDPYEWHWKDGRSRWDLLDPMRMMRALRPDGLKWPYLDEKPSVKLELMAKENGVLHENAHDALSDVLALISLAKKFMNSQPKLFAYLLKMRDKKEVAKLVESDEVFVYTSGKYLSDFLKTTVVKTLFKHPRREAAIVYDLREDPVEWLDMSAEELATHWAVKYGQDIKRLPVKTLQYNRCPSIAPMNVLDEESKKRIGYSENFERHSLALRNNPDFIEKIQNALDIIENEQQTRLIDKEVNVDSQIYSGFWSDADRAEMVKIRNYDPAEFSELLKSVKNARLRELMPLYKARNYSQILTPEEHEQWEIFKSKQLLYGGENSRVAKAMTRLNELSKGRLTKEQKYLLSELKMFIESIIPE